MKSISPLLDHFAIGDPISEHHGIRCCPAMQEETGKKYIVKIISIPASSVQLDALLLTGAYATKEDALSYFNELSQQVVAEVELLKKLSKYEGFLPYENYQIVPMEDNNGFEVYLLSPYRHSLRRYLRKNTMTQLHALNLGLDLCAGAAVSRKLGYIYTDFKPENIYMSEDHAFGIGDLGFQEIASLAYAALPDKYRSAYTPPENTDALSSIEMTTDIYSIGCILYEIYNGGVLPVPDQLVDAQLPPPAYADYELAEIILKACAADPKARWQSPIEMGQALVSYMQRNGVNDIPIIPPAPNTEDVTAAGDCVTAPAEDTLEDASGLISIAASADAYEQLQLEELWNLIGEDPDDSADTEDAEESSALTETEEFIDPDDPANISFLDDLTQDETSPAEQMADAISYQEVSEDTSNMLSQADALLSHPVPTADIKTVPIDVPIPPAITEPENGPHDGDPVADAESGPNSSADPEEPEPDDASAPEPSEPEGSDTASDLEAEDTAFPDDTPVRKNGSKRWVGIFAAFLVLLAVLSAGYLFLTEYYYQPIYAISLEGAESQLTVDIQSDIDESLLTAVCTDTYGNKQTAPVKDGKATFINLNSNTLYYIRLEISGIHKLVGNVSTSYTTPPETDIAAFYAIAGTEEGTVILHFDVDGVDTEAWKIQYFSEKEDARTVSANGHMATVSGLTVGETYTFQLVSDVPLYIVGTDSISYTVSPLVYAENLAIDRCDNGSLHVTWTEPAGTTVETWTVRCYNETGYEQIQEVTTPEATFGVPDTAQGYHVDVTAQGMSASRRTSVTTNSITVTEFTANVSSAIHLSWQFTGPAPTSEWLLLYAVDGSNAQNLIRTGETGYILENFIPGATYTFQLQTETGSTVFNGVLSVQTPAAPDFSNYLVTANNITAKMCRTPQKAGWTHWDVTAENYTNVFSPEEKASFVLILDRKYNTSDNVITSLFVIRNADGAVVSQNISKETWTNMWYKYHCELEIPSLPKEPGNYSIELFFNGAFVHKGQFEVK